MKSEDYQQLLTEIKKVFSAKPAATFGIAGHTPVTYDLIGFFRTSGTEHRLLGIYTEQKQLKSRGWKQKAFQDLSRDKPSVVVVASDAEKESLIDKMLPHITPTTQILLGGYGHFAFRDKVFEDVTRNPLVPSLANGYPNTLIHLYQCLQNAARLGLKGIVVEFGMFKGGTTMMLAHFIERLGQSWKVIGFDTFDGFPSPRSALDMYKHPDCVFPDEAAVRRYVKGRNIEVVSGDIVSTASRVSGENIILAFIDTDNYSSAKAILDAIANRVVVGGAIVFDHFTGRERFLYTLGERIAAKRLLSDDRYFMLHDTGVFMRQR